MAAVAISLGSVESCSQPFFKSTRCITIEPKSLFLSAHSSHPLLKRGRYGVVSPVASSPSSSSSAVFSDSLTDLSAQFQFLTPQDTEKLRLLQQFSRSCKIVDGSLRIGVMRAEQIDVTVWLLAESFAESMLVPMQYVKFLAFLVKQYVLERRAFLPHTATLVAFYERENGEEELAGTVEIIFNAKGANTSPPTPISPRDSPYICNMAVKKSLRRKGIGWNLLMASEQLISQMTPKREVFLHCRMIDTGPFKMYTKAGYSVMKTDSILAWLTFQRRKHLLCKSLPALCSSSDIMVLRDHPISSYDTM